MAGSKVKIWVGLGTYVLASSVGSAWAQSAADHGSHHGSSIQIAQATHSHGGQGGEGGEEGGEAGAENALQGLSGDQAFLANILMIRGHLNVGSELYAMGRPNDSLPHYLHPVEEIYGELTAEMEEHSIPPFRADLEKLANLAKRKAPVDQVQAQTEVVLGKLRDATAFLPTSDPSFMVPVVLGVLKTAADEYGAAFEGGVIANPVEYQDALGFARVANAAVEIMVPALTTKDAEAANTLREQVNTLLQAWPSVVPAKKPARTAAEFSGTLSRIELASSRLR
jgi:hypothetical protein